MASAPIDTASASLNPIPAHIHPWLRAVVVFGFLSFAAAITLLCTLVYRLIRWRIKSKATNQFAILILNLVLADIQQSMAFLSSVAWLHRNQIDVSSTICWAQGWFVSTGDMASGVWCFAIGLHTFASVIFNYQLPSRWFFVTVAALWVFIYGLAIVAVGLHPQDLYVRAGAWCWINHQFADLRLWGHYFWIFVFEFGNVIVYAIIYTVLLQRIRTGHYNAAEAERAKSVANLMVVYPIVYVVCTLPLASSRMAAMGGKPPSLARLCLSGAMITSNGWLDVLLYISTRRILLFSDEPPAETVGIDTFSPFWIDPKKRFGATTTIEACPEERPRRSGRGLVRLPEGSDSADDLVQYDSKNIKMVTTTQVTSEPLDEDFAKSQEDVRQKRPMSQAGRWSEDTDKGSSRGRPDRW